MAITFEEYQKAASRTANPHEGEKDNYMIGLIGEIGETVDLIKKFIFHGHDIDIDKIKKEAGDILWYSSQLMRILDVTFLDLFSQLKKKDESIRKIINERRGEEKLIKCSFAMNTNSSIIVEYIESNFQGEKFWDDLLDIAFKEILTNLYTVIRIAGLTIEEVAEANIKKLEARYPTGFDAEKSINRTE